MSENPTTSPSAPSESSWREPSLAELGIEAFEATEDPLSDFTVCGVNSNKKILETKTLGSWSMLVAEQELFPRSSAKDRGKLSRKMAEDNRYVLEKGVTHQNIAQALAYFSALAEQGIVPVGTSPITYNGVPLNIEVSQIRSREEGMCLFDQVDENDLYNPDFSDDDVPHTKFATNYEIKITNPKNGISFFLGVPPTEIGMIGRYGCYFTNKSSRGNLNSSIKPADIYRVLEDALAPVVVGNMSGEIRRKIEDILVETPESEPSVATFPPYEGISPEDVANFPNLAKIPEGNMTEADYISYLKLQALHYGLSEADANGYISFMISPAGDRRKDDDGEELLEYIEKIQSEKRRRATS